VTIALGVLTAAEKLTKLVKLAQTIKKVAAERRSKTIMVRGKHDDTKLSIDDHTSVDKLAETLRGYIED
jgi:hypothetical protein